MDPLTCALPAVKVPRGSLGWRRDLPTTSLGTEWSIDRSAGLGRTRLCHPWGREPEGGVVGRPRSVSHVVRPRQGSGFEGVGWVPLGPKRVCQGPVWSRMGPYISRTLIRDSRVIHQGPSGLVGSYRVPTGPEGGRRIARLSRIGARLMYGPPGHATASPRALGRPVRTRRTPGGPLGAPSDHV